MGALDNLINALPEEFDWAALLDPEAEQIESSTYDKSQIFKYFPMERQSFFARPQVRFSQREVLNDPFELTRRWKDASTDGFRDHLDKRLPLLLRNAVSDPDILFSLLREDLAERGLALSPWQERDLKCFMSTSEALTFLAERVDAIVSQIPQMVGQFFDLFETQFDSIIESVVGEVGILSLTEEPLNPAMWAHYASEGLGFVVAFDSKDDFFHVERADGTRVSSLRKILYTNKWADTFWRNPYSLFLIKSVAWSYECEWRQLIKLDECDEHMPAEHIVHLRNVPPHAISSILFGYKYNPAMRAQNMRDILNSGQIRSFFPLRSTAETEPSGRLSLASSRGRMGKAERTHAALIRLGLGAALLVPCPHPI